MVTLVTLEHVECDMFCGNLCHRHLTLRDTKSFPVAHIYQWLRGVAVGWSCWWGCEELTHTPILNPVYASKVWNTLQFFTYTYKVCAFFRLLAFCVHISEPLNCHSLIWRLPPFQPLPPSLAEHSTGLRRFVRRNSVWAVNGIWVRGSSTCSDCGKAGWRSSPGCTLTSPTLVKY